MNSTQDHIQTLCRAWASRSLTLSPGVTPGVEQSIRLAFDYLEKPVLAEPRWIDDKGTVWTQPTPEAYAAACKALQAKTDRIAAYRKATTEIFSLWLTLLLDWIAEDESGARLHELRPELQRLYNVLETKHATSQKQPT